MHKTRISVECWWARLGSNQEPTPYEGVALPLSYGPCRLGL